MTLSDFESPEGREGAATEEKEEEEEEEAEGLEVGVGVEVGVVALDYTMEKLPLTL